MLANVMPSVSAITLIQKFYIPIVTTLANLSAGYDNSGLDNPLSLKKAITSPY